MKYIFNSLGSNYSLSFVLHALLYFFLVPPKHLVMDQVDAQLRKLIPGFESGPYYFYKGRDALEFVLSAWAVAADEPVMTQAFTCHALEAAIRRAGGVPAYVDLAEGQLNPSVDTIAATYKRNPTARVLIIQHSLGVPAQITEIRKWCTKHKILLLEDLAQAVGGTDETGQYLGTHADAVIFSFGRDKIIDAVSGGAALIKKKPLGFANENYRTLTSTRFKRDHLYPVLTWVIRWLYPVYLGKIIAFLARFFRLIQSPIKPRFEFITAWPSALAALAVRQFERLDSQLSHRRAIAQIYYNGLSQLCPVPWKTLERGSNLRFPITVSNPVELVHAVQQQHIYLADRWYRQPVDSGSLQYFSKYRTGSCPQAEKLAQTIVNLPTHTAVTPEEAQTIVAVVQQVLEKKDHSWK